MGKTVTLEIPEPVMEQAVSLAERTERRVEDVLEDWLHRFTSDMPIELLSDDEVLALCDAQMDEADQYELQALLADQREGKLKTPARLDALLSVYRQGLVRKAKAIQVATSRGLRRPLS